MAENSVNPLSYNVPIVNKDGTPTNEFMRKWAQQGSTNGTIPDLSTAAAVSAILDLIGSTLGSVLVRGSTEWQAKLPGSVGQVLTVVGGVPAWADPAKGVTVGAGAPAALEPAGTLYSQSDAAAVWTSQPTGGGTIAHWEQIGGGVGSSVVFQGPAGSSSSASFASLGQIFSLTDSIKVSAVSFALTTVTGATYEIGVAPYNTAANQMTSAPTYTGSITSGTGATTLLRFKFASPLSLAGAANYIIFLVRTDSTTTVSQTFRFSNLNTAGPGIYMQTGNMRSVASVGPTTSSVWAANGLTGVFSFVIEYAF